MRPYFVVLRINGTVDAGNIAGAQTQIEDIAKRIKKMFTQAEINVEVANKTKTDVLEFPTTNEEKKSSSEDNTQNISDPDKPQIVKRSRGRPRKGH